MDLLHLVDRLEELVAGAQKMPIGNRAIVDRRRMLDLIDQMRIAVPREVREAQDIVAERDGIRREAEEEGRIIVAQAEERASALIEEHAITEGAKQRAEEIATEAERRLEQQIEVANRDMQARVHESRRIAQEQMAAADEYARELLIRLERQLQAFQNSVRAGVDQLEPQPTYDPRFPPLDDRAEDLARAAGPASGLATPQDQSTPMMPKMPRPDTADARMPVDYSAPADEPEYASEDEELEDLLGRQRSMRLDQADPGVIDDFENQPLDDDPMLRPAPRDPNRGERT
jgi:F0F1-type ATP synthase membrane subunit b/b'